MSKCSMIKHPVLASTLKIKFQNEFSHSKDTLIWPWWLMKKSQTFQYIQIIKPNNAPSFSSPAKWIQLRSSLQPRSDAMMSICASAGIKFSAKVSGLPHVSWAVTCACHSVYLEPSLLPLNSQEPPLMANTLHFSVDMHDVCKHLRGTKNHLAYNRSQDLLIPLRRKGIIPGQEDSDTSSPGVPCTSVRSQHVLKREPFSPTRPPFCTHRLWILREWISTDFEEQRCETKKGEDNALRSFECCGTHQPQHTFPPGKPL